MDFKVEGLWNTDKYFSAIMFGQPEKFWILDALKRLKQ